MRSEWGMVSANNLGNWECSGCRQILQHLSYWKQRSASVEFGSKDPHRYITFDVDQGGLNNIRLVFEYVAVIAAITGRSIVIPPPQPWYLLNNGPSHKRLEESVTEFERLFELPALEQVVSVLSTRQFINEAAGHLEIPARFQDDNSFSSGTEFVGDDYLNWKQWLLANGRVLADWNPHETLLCYPDIKSVDADHLPIGYVDNRRLVEFPPLVSASPLIHFPSNSQSRYLGPVATMLASNNRTLPDCTRRFVKHHVRYRETIYELASELVSGLGLFNFISLHIRRGDFQYSQSRALAEETLRNIEKLAPLDYPMYIATDENDPDFRNYFRSHRRTFFWEDLLAKFPNLEIPAAYVGPIEQILCACAFRFIGTDLSTFSTYIVRLRGYIAAPDTASYFHTEYYEKPKPQPTANDLRGRAYLRESPRFWLEC